MATQAERRAAPNGTILKGGRLLFGERGFAATTIDDIAEQARVAKGAVYHHFATKEAVFADVFDQVSRALVQEIDRAVRTEKDVLAAMVAGTQHYFAACAKGPACQIILRDGPAVLGWERWRGNYAQDLWREISRGPPAPLGARRVPPAPRRPPARA